MDETTERIGIEYSELFELFQMKRRELLEWLTKHPADWIDLFETVVERLTVDPAKWKSSSFESTVQVSTSMLHNQYMGLLMCRSVRPGYNHFCFNVG